VRIHQGNSNALSKITSLGSMSTVTLTGTEMSACAGSLLCTQMNAEYVPAVSAVASTPAVIVAVAAAATEP